MTGNANSGRKALPGVIHLLQGNRSKKAAGELANERRPPAAIPTPPGHMTATALAEWQRVVPLLEAMGIIAEIYRAPLAVYCQAWGRYVHAERKLAEIGDSALVSTTPSGYQQIGVWLQVSNRAAEQMKSFAAEFGMTPSAISRVTGAAAQGDLFGYGQGTQQGGAARFFT
ncbi:MAG: phage terminase small subunit P27 family [Dechloromonas sp.]|nr:MAG: phage terminase small subunit P27 family [Dechloromonas sp.]